MRHSFTISATSPFPTPWRSWSRSRFRGTTRRSAPSSSSRRSCRRPWIPRGPGPPDRIHRLILGDGDLPLRGLVSGSLDLDKMEYLRRDARFCGVPYGEVDVDRLIQGLVLLPDPGVGPVRGGGPREGGGLSRVSPFRQVPDVQECLLASWGPGRDGLYKRIVEEAVKEGLVTPSESGGPNRRGASLRDRSTGRGGGLRRGRSASEPGGFRPSGTGESPSGPWS